MQKGKKSAFLWLVVLMLTMLLGCGDTGNAAPPAKQKQRTKSTVTTTTAVNTAGSMKVHFLDVGQGLSILVQSEGQNLIYDGGNRDESSFVVSYLKQQGVTELDYLISSHYDADHLAGLVGCLKAFAVQQVIGADYEHDSNLYDSFMTAVAEKQLKVQHPKRGTKYDFGSGSFTVLSPATIQEDSNANSVVIKLENGSNSFLLTGDADHNAEEVMCNSDLDLSCDVLSVAHHGSATATSYDFLEQTLPEAAVISCGQDNQYGHPDKDTMDKLETMSIEVYRTDDQGTITATSDGQNITWSQQPCDNFAPGDQNDHGTQLQQEKKTVNDDDSDMVWKSATGKKYHCIPNCGKMNPDKATQITQAQAEAMGLQRCSKCY